MLITNYMSIKNY